MREKAIAVLSGGLDSTVAMSCYVNDYDIEAVTFDYGQKAIKQEIKAAKNICNHYNIPHTVIDLKWLGDISDSALNSDNDIPNPSDEDLDNLDEAQKRPMLFGFQEGTLFLRQLQHHLLKVLVPVKLL